jgi:hypothetical protein
MRSQVLTTTNIKIMDLLRRDAALIGTSVSEEHAISIFRVEEDGDNCFLRNVSTYTPDKATPEKKPEKQ